MCPLEAERQKTGSNHHSRDAEKTKNGWVKCIYVYFWAHYANTFCDKPLLQQVPQPKQIGRDEVLQHSLRHER